MSRVTGGKHGVEANSCAAEGTTPRESSDEYLRTRGNEVTGVSPRGRGFDTDRRRDSASAAASSTSDTCGARRLRIPVIDAGASRRGVTSRLGGRSLTKRRTDALARSDSYWRPLTSLAVGFDWCRLPRTIFHAARILVREHPEVRISRARDRGRQRETLERSRLANDSAGRPNHFYERNHDFNYFILFNSSRADGKRDCWILEFILVKTGRKSSSISSAK